MAEKKRIFQNYSARRRLGQIEKIGSGHNHSLGFTNRCSDSALARLSLLLDLQSLQWLRGTLLFPLCILFLLVKDFKFIIKFNRM